MRNKTFFKGLKAKRLAQTTARNYFWTTAGCISVLSILLATAVGMMLSSLRDLT